MKNFKKTMRIIEVVAGLGMMAIGITSLIKHMMPVGGIVFFALAIWWIIDGLRGLDKIRDVKKPTD
jgi:hypothetical protein